MIPVLCDLLYMIPLGALTVYAGGLFFAYPEQALLPYLCAAVLLGITLAVKHWDNRLRFLIPGVPAAMLAGLLFIADGEKRQAFLEGNRWLVWMIPAVFLCYMAGRLASSYPVVRRVLFTGLFLALMVSMTTGLFSSRMTVPAAFLPMLAIAVQEIQLKWEKSGYTDGRAHLVSIAPFLVLISVLVFLLPAPEEPYDWNFAVRIWERSVDVVKRAGNLLHQEDEDYEAMIGFTDNGVLMGNLGNDSREMMKLTTDRNSGNVVYLAGKTMDTFDGREWTEKNGAQASDRIMDTLESLCAVYSYDPAIASDVLRRADIGVQYLDFRTRYLFTPLKPVLAVDLADEIPYGQLGGDLLAVDQLRYGSFYRIPVYRINQDQEIFREVVNHPAAMDEAQWEQTRAMVASMLPGTDAGERAADTVLPGTGWSGLPAYRERIRSYDLQKTEISDRLEKYLDGVMAGADSDLERLERLETLLSGFEYSSSPGRLPAEVRSPAEYLDHLFYTEQKGYCSHFATAFVLIARHMGIPARYVQGYYVRCGREEVTLVTSDMAHAWPEAYLTGFGWVPFEPTPGMRSVSSWEVTAPRSGAPERVTPDLPQQAPAEEIPLPEEEAEERHPVNPAYILVPLLLGSLFLALFLAVNAAINRRNYWRMGESGRFRASCARNLAILRFMGFVIGQGETLQEFRDRLTEKLPEEALGFIGCMEEHAYAGREADSGMRAGAESSESALMAELKRQKGRWFFLYRFLLSGRRSAPAQSRSVA